MHQEPQQNNLQLSTKTMVWVALMTAITCVLAPFSFPLPFSPVPITLTNLAVTLSAYLLGAKHATLSIIIYLLLGSVGLPIFSNFEGGLGKLLGPTGGYLIGFIFIAFFTGFFAEKFDRKSLPTALGMIVGTIICYLLGTFWLSRQLDLTFLAALGVGVLPYIIGDIVKMALVIVIAPAVYRRI